MNAASCRRLRRGDAGRLPPWPPESGSIALGGAWNLYKQKEESRFQTAIGEAGRVGIA